MDLRRAAPADQLADLRAVAAEVGLVCPYDRSAATTLAAGESPSAVLARLEKPRWVCYWFEE